MPRIKGIDKVLVIGSGGIQIAQAAEFDYSGSQALKALREEGIKSILINPNVATIQTSMKMADRVYLEPITADMVHQVIKEEKPDGVLLGFGGQTALNVGVELAKMGVFEREDVKVLGTPIEAIEKTEDRGLFKRSMLEIDVGVPESDVAYSVDDALRVARDLGYPVIVRVAYTLGGGGAGIAYDASELKGIVERALPLSLERQVLVERYLEHWKEVEYEVMRDYKDNTITICALENFDPLGIHTGDSIVVAPTQTLTDDEYQMLRSAAIRVIRHLKIVGECNIQFGLDPESERFVAIEVNARMSRSSALASKASGYPLAYIAAKLALGYTLPELMNKVTGITTACFEPALDYVVVKIPRWDFDKFPGPVDRRIGPQMKSVGEVMAIARSFEEALQKAVRCLEIGKIGLMENTDEAPSLSELKKALRYPTDNRLFDIVKAMKAGLSVQEIRELTGVDAWFLYKIKKIVDLEEKLKRAPIEDEGKLKELVKQAKKLGFSDKQIANYLGITEDEVRNFRKRKGIIPAFKIIDTMAAEWASQTNYCYITYGDEEDDVSFEGKKKVLVIGASCNRIGSSVEFDYCTMNTAWSLKEEGIDEVIVLNNNPETVSTDFDMNDKLYFEEVTLERVLDIVDKEKPMGVVVSVGGQTPNTLALPLARRGVKLLGTSAKSIDVAEDRSKFSDLLDKLDIPQPEWRSLTSFEDVKKFAKAIGYPIIVRPSYVLSGQAMRVARDEDELVEYLSIATKVSPDHPVVVSKFLKDAKEVEVDAVSDGKDALIGAVIEHVELAGTHSGDATMVIPSQSLDKEVVGTIKDYARRLARALKIRGPFNVQFIVKGGKVYVIELNLRASRSFPFTSKATGIPLIKIATKAMLGHSLKEAITPKEVRKMHHVAVKAPTFSYMRIKGADPTQGVEMTSTGEVACFDYSFAKALIKALMASGMRLPSTDRSVFITVRDEDRRAAVEVAKKMVEAGFDVIATEGTAKNLASHGVSARVVGKLGESDEIREALMSRKVGMVINTPSPTKRRAVDDGYIIRRTATEFQVPVITRIEAALAIASALKEGVSAFLRARPLDEYSPGFAKMEV